MRINPFKIYLFVIALGLLENLILILAFRGDFYFCSMLFIAYVAVITIIFAGMFLKQEEVKDQETYQKETIDEVVNNRKHRKISKQNFNKDPYIDQFNRLVNPHNGIKLKLETTTGTALKPKPFIPDFTTEQLKRIQEIRNLRKKGHVVKELTPFQFRVDNTVDLYPVNCKFHNIKTQERGIVKNFKTLPFLK
jgi:hypothetical protein